MSVRTFDTSLNNQAEIFSQYIIGYIAPQNELKRFAKIVGVNSKLNKVDQKFIDCICKHPKTLRYIDAYLAIFDAESELRHRIYTMFSVLEASPMHWNKFISRKHSLPYFFYIVWCSIKAAISVFIGALLCLYVRVR